MRFHPSVDHLGDRVLPSSMMIGAVVGSDPFAPVYAPIGSLVGARPYQVSTQGPDPGENPSLNDGADPIPTPSDPTVGGAVGPG